MAPGGAEIVIPVARREAGLLDTLAGAAASQERYRTLFETMPQGVVHYDADGSRSWAWTWPR